MTDADHQKLLARLDAIEKQLHGLTKWCAEMFHRLNKVDPLPPVPEPRHQLPRHYLGPSMGLIDVPGFEPPTQQTQREISEQK